MAYLAAIDGTDASGKATQTALLASRLKKIGYNVLEISYPDYDCPSSGPVKMYLDGELGEHAGDTDAYAASVLFAVDRFASFRAKWKKFYERDDYIILLNRYTTANAVHQLSKIDDNAEKERFLDWLFDFEYCLLGIPAPDTVIYLEMPTEISLSLLEKRCRETGASKDIHELDRNHLQKSSEAAAYACEKLGWNRILCGRGGKPLPIEEINETVFRTFMDGLPKNFAGMQNYTES